MQFSYVAVDTSNGRQKGIVEANTQKEVVEYLRAKKLVPISVKEISSVSQGIKLFSKVRHSELVIFTRQLASMLTTGLTLLEALDILKQESNRPEMAKLIDHLVASISEGESFSNALSKHRDVFSNVYIALVKAAETSGMLDRILARLADNLEQQEDLRKKVQSAMIYPAIVMVGVISVIIIMNVFIIPSLGSMYTSMGLQLPWTTQVILAISSFVKNFFPLVIIAIIVIVFIYRRFQKTEKGRELIDGLKLKIPVIGTILRLSILDEISRTLAILIASGSSILETLNITSQVADNVKYHNAIQNSITFVQQGIALSTALNNQNIFPPIFIQMVRVGESTGRIDEGLLKVSEYFERDLNLKIKNFTTAIEPIIIIVLGLCVAFLIISVITPIYSLITQIH